MINFLDDSIQITSFSCQGTKYFPIFQTAKFFIRAIQISVPFVLIIWGSIDWFKALIAHDEKEMRMKRKPFVKRVIFAMLILILPWIIQLISDQVAGSNNFWTCYSEAKAKLDFSKTTTSNKRKTCSDFSKKECPKQDDYGLLCTKYKKECILQAEYDKLTGDKDKEPVITQQGTVNRNTSNGTASGSGGSGSSNSEGPGSGTSYGSAEGSTVITYGSNKYVVVDTKYPGGVKGYQSMVKKNGVYQSYLKNNVKDVSNAGGCCGGVSQVQACGLKKGMDITTGNITKGYTLNAKGEKVSKCNGSNISGCSGSWGSGKCFDDESSFLKYVIENVQKGNPVIINVTGCDGNRSKCSAPKGKYSRHYVTVVGFKEGSNGTSYTDLLIIDSWDGILEALGKRKIQTDGVVISNHPCKSSTKNFASAITK